MRMSVNNKDIIQMYLGYEWLITQKTLPIRDIGTFSEVGGLRSKVIKYMPILCKTYMLSRGSGGMPPQEIL